MRMKERVHENEGSLGFRYHHGAAVVGVPAQPERLHRPFSLHLHQHHLRCFQWNARFVSVVTRLTFERCCFSVQIDLWLQKNRFLAAPSEVLAWHQPYTHPNQTITKVDGWYQSRQHLASFVGALSRTYEPIRHLGVITWSLPPPPGPL